MLVKDLIKILSEEDPEAEVGNLVVAVRGDQPVAVSVASKFTIGVASYKEDNKVFITGQSDADSFIKADYTKEEIDDFKKGLKSGSLS